MRKTPRKFLDHNQKNLLFYNKYNIKNTTSKIMGYPCNMDFDYSEIEDFFSFHINNAGDPFGNSIYQANTHNLECDVIQYFIEKNRGNLYSHWGYVTTGSTESNLQGLRIARKKYPRGVVLYSEDTHYSITKAIDILSLASSRILSNTDGSINIEYLDSKLRTSNKNLPIIMVVNVGTTMKGGIDNIKEVIRILEKNNKEYYIHVDAAFYGGFLPYVNSKIPYRFDNEKIDSIVISGQKFIGTPFPCGIFLTKKEHIDAFDNKIVGYLGGVDNTISGSRNGLSALLLWYAIQTQDFAKKISYMLFLKEYMLDRLQQIDIETHTVPYSPIIWWSDETISLRYLLENQIPNIIDSNGNRVYHLIANSHITVEVFDKFMEEASNVG